MGNRPTSDELQKTGLAISGAVLALMGISAAWDLIMERRAQKWWEAAKRGDTKESLKQMGAFQLNFAPGLLSKLGKTAQAVKAARVAKAGKLGQMLNKLNPKVVEGIHRGSQAYNLAEGASLAGLGSILAKDTGPRRHLKKLDSLSYLDPTYYAMVKADKSFDRNMRQRYQDRVRRYQQRKLRKSMFKRDKTSDPLVAQYREWWKTLTPGNSSGTAPARSTPRRGSNRGDANVVTPSMYKQYTPKV